MTTKPRDPAWKPRRAFAKRLKAARISAGYDYQKDFADKIQSEHETYRRWERAETEPPLYMLMRIREETGKSLDFLICGQAGKNGE